jgi:hypothetical protein
MLNTHQLDDLTKRIMNTLPRNLHYLHEDVQRSLRATLESSLNRLNLVTREEFDVQSAVLVRSREKLTQLEKRVALLEHRLQTSASANESSEAP